MEKKTGRTKWEELYKDMFSFQEEILFDHPPEDHYEWFPTGWSIRRDGFRWEVRRSNIKESRFELVTWFWRKKQAMDYVEVLYRMGVEP